MRYPAPGRTFGFGCDCERPWENREWHERIRQSRAHVATLRAAVVAVAEREYNNWHNPNLTERIPAGRALVRQYWLVGVNRTVSDANLASAAWQEANPWSAAFISYVMREAGAGAEFPYASAHAAYIRAAIDNRRHHVSSIFQGFRLSERRGMLTHCDIVTALDPAAGVAHAIGGNVHQNVDRKTNLRIDVDGHLTAAGYFAVIKMEPIIPAYVPSHSCEGPYSRSWRIPGVVRCLPESFGLDPMRFNHHGGGMDDCHISY
jgi:hypothetical protein